MPALIALIMAGGKGTRIKELNCEKPLIKILGTPMIDYVITALSKSHHIREIFVATSPFTLMTEKHAKRRKIKIIKTPGSGYVTDLKLALGQIRSKHVLVCPADLPLLTPPSINSIIDAYFYSKTPSLVVAVPLHVIKSLNLSPTIQMTVNGRIIVPCGVSIIKRNELLTKKHVNEEFLITENIEFAVNVNTIRDLKVAEQILIKRKLSEKTEKFDHNSPL
ncbi:MAG: NTP transferase domain-containing protein [Candidatus Baldrarchaeia archaeon]